MLLRPVLYFIFSLRLFLLVKDRLDHKRLLF